MKQHKPRRSQRCTPAARVDGLKSKLGPYENVGACTASGKRLSIGTILQSESAQANGKRPSGRTLCNARLRICSMSSDLARFSSSFQASSWLAEYVSVTAPGKPCQLIQCDDDESQRDGSSDRSTFVDTASVESNVKEAVVLSRGGCCRIRPYWPWLGRVVRGKEVRKRRSGEPVLTRL